jgi:Mlc titration factor MtfA (ptsG expression regulator)
LRDIPRRRWIQQFQLAYDRLVAAGPGHSPIDHYASESAGEYFAVVSELHYSQPTVLRETEPAVAELLQAFYGPSPADGEEPCGGCRR